MAFLDTVIEWFNGLIGLEYAGYGPITAIFIGILTVAISMRVVKFFFKPFAPLFQTAAELGEDNPVLKQQGIRHSQLAFEGPASNSANFERSDDKAGILRGTQDRFEAANAKFAKTRLKAGLKVRSRREELMNMDLGAADDRAESKPNVDFGDALDKAMDDDAEAPARRFKGLRGQNKSAKLSLVKKANGSDKTSRPSVLSVTRQEAPATDARPTASSTPQAGNAMPLIQITSFGREDQEKTAANRLALRLGEGVTETLARIPNLAVETATSACLKNIQKDVPGFGTRFVVEGDISLEDRGVVVAIKVHNGADGSELLRRDMMCKPSELQKFEKEVALEIAAAVIAHQRSSGQSVSKHLHYHSAAQSSSTYPSVRRPLTERLGKTDRPVQ